MKPVPPSTVLSSAGCVVYRQRPHTQQQHPCAPHDRLVLHFRACLSDGCLKLLRRNKSSEANVSLSHVSEDADGSDRLPCLQRLRHTRLETRETHLSHRVHAVHVWSGTDVIHTTKRCELCDTWTVQVHQQLMMRFFPHHGEK